MTIVVQVGAYNSHGGDWCSSTAGWYLTRHTGEYGAGISEICVDLLLRSSGPPKRRLRDLYQTFHKYRQELPKLTFYRKKGKIEIDLASRACDAETMDANRGRAISRFLAAMDEVIEVLKLIKGKLRRSDDFDLDRFLEDVAAARARAPRTQTELDAFWEELMEEDRQRLANMDEWERLGVDWDEYHKDARELLDDPFFWCISDDYSPHGSDTGADVLDMYQEWRREHRRGNPLQFLEELLVGWGVSQIDWSAAGEADVREITNRDEYALALCDDAVIALAFAQIKITGACSDELIRMALAAIARERMAFVVEHNKWPSLEDRRSMLERMKNKLVEIRDSQ